MRIGALTRHRIDTQAVSFGPADLRAAAETIYRQYAAQSGLTGEGMAMARETVEAGQELGRHD